MHFKHNHSGNLTGTKSQGFDEVSCANIRRKSRAGEEMMEQHSFFITVCFDKTERTEIFGPVLWFLKGYRTLTSDLKIDPL